MYCHTNYQSKKALKDDVKAGKRVTYYQPGLGDTPMNGTIVLEGPHFPKPHKWYAEAVVKDGVIIKVK